MYRKGVNDRNNPLRRLYYAIAGAQHRYYEAPSEVRAKIRRTARRLQELGVDFSTAARNELTNREGFIYVISHPSWPQYVKIGRAFDPESRLRGYQTGCPLREYELQHAVYFTDCHDAEKAIHERLAHKQMKGEWFALSISDAVYAINVIKEII